MNQEQVDIKTPEFVSIQFQPAGLGSRASAFIIDSLLLLVINVLIIVGLIFSLNAQSLILFWAEMGSVPVAIAIIAIFILNWGYFFAFEFFSGGRTLGKKWMGLRVIQDNGHSLTLLSSFIRNLLRIIDSLPASYFLGMIMIFFHSKHKRIGDLVAGTIVVHERKEKRKKKQSAIEKEIKNRKLSKEDLSIEEWALKSLGMKEWNLVKTYTTRCLQLPIEERLLLTRQVGEIIIPKAGLQIDEMSMEEVENTLFILFLILRDEWEFEL
ncbi:RDD family protein [Bacillus sp. DJP31]|uniref:RDD family protein n=1 Tax=Bacillus sp. DJP31 TaxID=3409789 RepID=UPI003BB55C85